MLTLEPRMKPLSDCRSIEEVVEPETLEENIEACREASEIAETVDESIRRDWLTHCNNVLFETQKYFYSLLQPFEWSYHVANTPRKACVYFVRSGDGGLTKIGRSVNFKNRLSSLGTSAQSAIHTVNTLPVHEEMLGVSERYFHRRFSEKRIKGEWFQITDAEINSAISEFDYEQMAKAHWPKSTGANGLHALLMGQIFGVFEKRFKYLKHIERHWIQFHGGSKLRFVIDDHPDPNPNSIFTIAS